MMKKYSIILLAAALLGAACNKPEKFDIAPAQKLVHKTFTVSAPGDDTKTALAADGVIVNWSAGDEINVIGVTADGTTATQHPFTLVSGAGTPNATFEGEVGADETTFYAVYPNVAIKTASLIAATPLIDFNYTFPKTQTAVKNGFEKGAAPMTAQADADGNFAFRHGAAFFKITVGNDNVSALNIQTSNTRFAGRPQYNLDGSYNAIQNATGMDNITLNGPLEKGATYFIPVLCKNSTLKTLTVTYSFSDGTADKSISTEGLSTLKPALGTIYDLKTVTFALAPEISAENVSLEANATSGAIAYTIVNPVSGGSVTAALKEASDWLTVGTVSNGSVALSCGANTGDARSAVVTLTYTYGSDSVTKNVTVTQKAAGATTEDYVWDFSTDGWQSALNTQAPSAKDTKASNWSVSYDDLSYSAGSDDRWSVNGYIQPNGSGYYKASSKRRYFLFSTDGGGYVYVTVGSNSSSNKTAGVCAQLGEKNSPDFTQSVTSTASSLTTVELGPFNDGGDIAVFLDNSGHRIYKIEFHTNKVTE